MSLHSPLISEDLRNLHECKLGATMPREFFFARDVDEMEVNRVTLANSDPRRYAGKDSCARGQD